MDINTIRGLATLIALVAFVSVVLWAYSGRRKSDFDEAASLPFADDPDTDTPKAPSGNNGYSDKKTSPERGVQ